MAQPNVAREPSMEEILASIRRIIESNDPVTDAAGLRAVPDAYAYEDESIDGDDAGFAPELAANDPGMPVQPERRPMPEPVAAISAAGPERSLSLADVAARVRAASARHQELASMRPVPREEEPVAERHEPVVAAREPVMPLVSPQESFQASADVEQPAAVEPMPVPELPVPELRPALERPAEASRAGVPDYSSVSMDERQAETETPRLPVHMEAMSSLLSEAAGAQVAKSFGELADVFDGLERRSVEDMAQDMLRPMLQEWLDDNLPTLVERLVREEIERVARGPRR